MQYAITKTRVYFPMHKQTNKLKIVVTIHFPLLMFKIIHYALCIRTNEFILYLALSLDTYVNGI